MHVISLEHIYWFGKFDMKYKLFFCKTKWLIIDICHLSPNLKITNIKENTLKFMYYRNVLIYMNMCCLDWKSDTLLLELIRLMEKLKQIVILSRNKSGTVSGQRPEIRFSIFMRFFQHPRLSFVPQISVRNNMENVN